MINVEFKRYRWRHTEVADVRVRLKGLVISFSMPGAPLRLYPDVSGSAVVINMVYESNNISADAVGMRVKARRIMAVPAQGDSRTFIRCHETNPGNCRNREAHSRAHGLR